MGTSLDQVLSGETVETPPSDAQQSQVAAPAEMEQPRTGEPTDQTPPADVAGADGAAAQTDAPPASEQAPMVPLKALEEERKGRQDWKEKAIRFEEELKHLRASQGQAQPSQQQPQERQAALTYEGALLNERMNMSEMMVRQQHSDADVDAALEVFQKAVQENPALGAQLAQQRHPWQFMFDQAKRIQAMSEIGSDPAAYRQKVRDEILAELQQQQGAAAAAPPAAAAVAAAAPVIPRSLATARSAAPRTAPAWTGPTALTDILKR
ncbi:hypothetical protein [Burkholderia cepacia]|uniref:hypothetical protein n=1 Tax=Burkholderia cepacia TaxID=292 RepID=UPI001CF5048D|nr:hypothetical protein [Burkholderia cepacia]MCA8331882.1 hypothetical protein [Burkholderia cepacia]